MRIKKDPIDINNRNHFEPEECKTLRDAIDKGVVSESDHRKEVLLHNRRVSILSTTILSTLSKYLNKHLDQLSKISNEYFSENPDHRNRKEKLYDLELFCNAFNWGHPKIIDKAKKITFKLNSPPHGMQTYKDDWTSLAKIIEGYIKTIDPKLSMKSYEQKKESFTVVYA